MPQSLTYPFYAFKLHLLNGETVSFPLTDVHSMHLNQDIKGLSEKFAGQYQEKVLDKGQLAAILKELKSGDFEKSTVVVDFPAAKDGIGYPPFQLEFDYYFQTTEKGIWAKLPALGLECMALSADVLADRLREVVRMEFTSEKRLQALQLIISTAWFEKTSLEEGQLELKFHTPFELEELQKENKKKLLTSVARELNITRPAAYGRETEIGQALTILKSRFLRNILVVGPSGTGKTALIWELSRRCAETGIDARFWETTASILIKELTQDTGWQDNLNFLVKELTSRTDFLFVRNLAELFEVGQYSGNDISVAEYLRPFLGRGEITLITECTQEERARIEVRSPDYLAFFQPILLQEPTDALEEIIIRKVGDVATERKVFVEAEAVKEIIRLHRRFSPYSGMPGKPIRFLESIILTMDGSSGDDEAQQKKSKPSAIHRLDRSTVIRHFCEESGLPPFMADPELPMDLAAIKTLFNRNVFGQEQAVGSVTDLLAAVKTALTRTGKPVASFLFVGPTGVGKTELAKVLAAFMFGSRERLLRFDMSEFSDPWSAMRLVGQSNRSDGLLTAAVRREPFCVLLFDEIEKADNSFFDLLLQILGEGRLSDSRGKLVNFCSAIIIMTSNIGASSMNTNRIGWKKEVNANDVKAHFMSEVEKVFRPELFNRMDAVVPFGPLMPDTVRYVVEREIDLFKKREGIQFRHLDMQIDDEVLDFLAKKGYDPQYGARYLQRAIRELLIIPLSKALNEYDYDDRLILKITLTEEKVNFQVASDPLGFDLLMEQWDKLTLAEQAGDLRRKTSALLQGAFYLRFLTELDVMEADKKRQGEEFWKNVARAKQYSLYLNARETANRHYQTIQDYELEIALACMEEVPFQTDFGERIQQWKNEVFAFKTGLYSLLFPRQNACRLTFYGTDMPVLLRTYLGIFKAKGFVVKSPRSIWHVEGQVPGNDDSLEVINTVAKSQESEENESNKPRTRPAQNAMVRFVKKACSVDEMEKLNFEPPAKNSRMYGFEMEVTGRCVWLYLKDEKGIHHRDFENEREDAWFSVVPTLKIPKFPEEDIRRLSFYKNEKPRRIYTNKDIKDKKLGIDEAVDEPDQPFFIQEKLDDQFNKIIEAVFEMEEMA